MSPSRNGNHADAILTACKACCNYLDKPKTDCGFGVSVRTKAKILSTQVTVTFFMSLLLWSPWNSVAQGIISPDNRKLVEMTNSEFQNIFSSGQIKRGTTLSEVQEILGSPSEILRDRNGRTIWQFDSTKVTIIGSIGFARGDKYKFAVVVFDEQGVVIDLKHHVR